MKKASPKRPVVRGIQAGWMANSLLFLVLVVVVGIARWVRGEKTLSVLKFYGISAAGFLLVSLAMMNLLYSVSFASSPDALSAGGSSMPLMSTLTEATLMPVMSRTAPETFFWISAIRAGNL